MLGLGGLILSVLGDLLGIGCVGTIAGILVIAGASILLYYTIIDANYESAKRKVDS